MDEISINVRAKIEHDKLTWIVLDDVLLLIAAAEMQNNPGAVKKTMLKIAANASEHLDQDIISDMEWDDD